MLSLRLWFSYSTNVNQCYDTISLFLKCRKVLAIKYYEEKCQTNCKMKVNHQAMKYCVCH